MLFRSNLKIAATPKSRTQKSLTIQSPFLRGSIEGDYSYRTLPASLLNIMRRYLPSLILPDKKPTQSDNNFRFDLHVYDTELLSTVFLLPIKVYTHSAIHGYFNDKTQRLRMEGYFPRLRYENKFIESGMFLCENPNDRFHVHLRFNNRKTNGSVNMALEAEAQNDSIRTTLNWGNSSEVTYSIIHSNRKSPSWSGRRRSLSTRSKPSPCTAPLSICTCCQFCADPPDTSWKEPG